jgi:hypothetical protein
MRSDARQRLLAIAGGGLTVKSGVTSVAPFDTPRALQPATPADWKNHQLNQCVTPVTPCHTIELEGYKKTAENNGIGGVRQGVALGVTATEGLARLDPAGPPCNVPVRRWVQFIDDCGRFLDGGWAARAAALGWGPLDLFGCDRERPFVRVDHLGLLWVLNGGTLVVLHRDRAILETERGVRQCYRRRPVEVGRVVLAWELPHA